VILVDANVLLYAYDPRSAHHDRCRAWVERVFSGGEPVCISWVTLLAFIRISTSPRVYEMPLTIAEAVAIVSSWLVREAVLVLEAGEQAWEILRGLLVEAQVAGPLVMDAFLAALALENGAALATTDRDFSRFAKLRRIDPTASSGLGA
jgi:toxin-antitoxin system PIN domain toxin